jgi:hypothetical protein
LRHGIGVYNSWGAAAATAEKPKSAANISFFISFPFMLYHFDYRQQFLKADKFLICHSGHSISGCGESVCLGGLMARFDAGPEEHSRVVGVSGFSILHPVPAECLLRLLPPIPTQVY